MTKTFETMDELVAQFDLIRSGEIDRIDIKPESPLSKRGTGYVVGRIGHQTQSIFSPLEDSNGLTLLRVATP